MQPRLMLALLILACASASAQTAMLHHHSADSSAKFRELPPPPIMQGIGEAGMKITTSSEQAQAYFNQGLGCCTASGILRPTVLSKRPRAWTPPPPWLTGESSRL